MPTDPDGLFDAQYYLAANPDVAAAGVDPLAHYLAFGAQEGRPIFPAGSDGSDTALSAAAVVGGAPAASTGAASAALATRVSTHLVAR